MFTRLIVRRILASLGTLLLVSIFIFAAVEVLPGDVARQVLGRGVSEEQVNLFRHEMGFDRPVIERYLSWFQGTLHLDFGRGLLNRRPVLEIVAPRLRNTLILGAAAF